MFSRWSLSKNNCSPIRHSMPAYSSSHKTAPLQKLTYHTISSTKLQAAACPREQPALYTKYWRNSNNLPSNHFRETAKHIRYSSSTSPRWSYSGKVPKYPAVYDTDVESPVSSSPTVSTPRLQTALVMIRDLGGAKYSRNEFHLHWSPCNSEQSLLRIAGSAWRPLQDENRHFTVLKMDAGVHHHRTMDSRHRRRNRRVMHTTTGPRWGLTVHFTPCAYEKLKLKGTWADFLYATTISNKTDRQKSKEEEEGPKRDLWIRKRKWQCASLLRAVKGQFPWAQRTYRSRRWRYCKNRNLEQAEWWIHYG